LKLVGRTSQTFAVADVLSDAASMVAHDLVLLHEDDARKVLGLAPGQASDLAIDVFHEQEEQAILPDLAQAFDFQVQITPRSRTAGRIASELGRFGSLSVLASVPSLLALALLVSFLAVEARHSRRDVGRLKALGWSSSEIVAHHAIRTALLGVPIAIAGLFCAALVVFWPGVTWPGRWFFDWQGHAPELTLVSSDATLVLLGVAALVLAPFTAATLIPVALGASSSPADLLDTGSR
jgi:ABC-type lipoprotein release transport system permease subunit